MTVKHYITYCICMCVCIYNFTSGQQYEKYCNKIHEITFHLTLNSITVLIKHFNFSYEPQLKVFFMKLL